MDRAQFMEQLKKLLSDISETERQEALDYYESYFDEAGPENEASVIRELGSPGKVAAIIKADLNESSGHYGEYTENGYQDTREETESLKPEKYQGDYNRNSSGRNRRWGRRNENSRTYGENEAYESSRTREGDRSHGNGASHGERGYHVEPKRSNAKMILILILLVFLSPLILGGVGGALGILVVILLAPFLLVFVVGVVSISVIAAGVACFAVGVGLCFSYPAAGILTIGIGCLLLAAGLLLLMLLVWLAAGILPKLLRKVTDFCGNLLHRERKDGEKA